MVAYVSGLFAMLVHDGVTDWMMDGEYDAAALLTVFLALSLLAPVIARRV
jgi:hypothetical protein